MNSILPGMPVTSLNMDAAQICDILTQAYLRMPNSTKQEI